MDVPTGVGPTGKKEFTVGRVLDNNVEVNEINVSSNELTLSIDHNLTTGESVTLNSDNGILPVVWSMRPSTMLLPLVQIRLS